MFLTIKDSGEADEKKWLKEGQREVLKHPLEQFVLWPSYEKEPRRENEDEKIVMM